MEPQEKIDERRALRRRVIKGGVIAFSQRHITYNCVVLNMSDGGARLKVHNAKEIPNTFELLIDLDGIEAECRVVWRSKSELGLRFVSEPKFVAPRRAQIVSESVTLGDKPSIRSDRNAHTAAASAAPVAAANVHTLGQKGRIGNPIPILVAEDDPDDRLLIREAFDESGFDHLIDFVKDGEELLQYLSEQNDGVHRPKPRLILLDLNMPKIDGRQALRHLKENPATRRIPVVVLTTSNAEEDIDNTYELGVCSYITKPSSFDGLKEVISALNVYWSNAVVLPAAGRA